jgi:hypothetical protein
MLVENTTGREYGFYFSTPLFIYEIRALARLSTLTLLSLPSNLLLSVCSLFLFVTEDAEEAKFNS